MISPVSGSAAAAAAYFIKVLTKRRCRGIASILGRMLLNGQRELHPALAAMASLVGIGPIGDIGRGVAIGLHASTPM